jgi:sulfide:quinone oxidoreductase
MILDTDLRKRRMRDRVPITFVTSEPYIGHMGLGGVGDSKGLLESELRQRHIKWITNASVLEVTADMVRVAEHDEQGERSASRSCPAASPCSSRRSAALPRWPGWQELCNPRGFVKIDEFQRNPAFPNVYAAGCAWPFRRSRRRRCPPERRRPAT